MKLFCSTAMTGENEGEVTARMQRVVEVLRVAGHNAYCQSLDTRMEQLKSRGVKALLADAFVKLAECDGLVAIVTSERKSEGMLMEVGVALVGAKPVYLFMHESATTVPSHLPKLASKVFVWRTDEDLQRSLGQF